MADQLFKANLASDIKAVEDVQLLLKSIRESWAQIPADVHQVSSIKSHKK
jgi:flagellin-specific chaperone FliS